MLSSGKDNIFLLPIDNLQAQYRNGQVFLTWEELDINSTYTYNVYTHNKVITTATISKAKKIASWIEPHSASDWWQSPASFKSGAPLIDCYGFVIQNDFPPLNPFSGLFVHRITSENEKDCYYAVTYNDDEIEKLLLYVGAHAHKGFVINDLHRNFFQSWRSGLGFD